MSGATKAGRTMAVAFEHETEFLRECAKRYSGEIGFSPTAERDFQSLGIVWSDIHQVLSACRVVWSDKEDAADTKSIVVGKTCDGERLRLTVIWGYPDYRLLVISVERL